MPDRNPRVDFTNLTGRGVSVAIIDSGVDPCHPRIGAIQSNTALSVSVEESPTFEADFTDPAGHGTACAGIVKQLAPDAMLYSLRIFGASLTGDGRAIVSAIHWAIAQNVNVINMSLGTTDGTFKSQLANVCVEAFEAGVIIVAADHNDGIPSYPASLPEVIGVGGTSIQEPFGYFFRPGQRIECLARGDHQRVCWKGGKEILMGGTSFAAPRISALIAMILEAFPGTGLKEVRKILKANSISNSPSFPREDLPDHRRASRKETGKRSAFTSKKFDWIKRAALYPFNKELHALVRFRDLLPFEIVAVADPVGKGLVGKDAGEAIGISNVGIRITSRLSDAIRSADTLILGCIDQLVRMSKRDLLRTSAELALDNGTNIFSLPPIRREIYPDIHRKAEAKNLNLQYPDISMDEVASALEQSGEYGPVDVPVLGIFGTSSQQGKFTAQLALRRQLIRRGYRVGQIGTEHHSELFGMDLAFPMGYNSPLRIPLQYFSPFLDYKMREISTRNPDIIITGSQSGTVPYDVLEPSTHSLPTIAFILGVKPDASILVVNSIDSVGYIRDSIDGLRVIGQNPTILLAISDKRKHTRTAYGRQIVTPDQMSEDEISKTLSRLEEEFCIPAISIASPEGQEKMANLVVDYFSYKETSQGAVPCPTTA
jgi:uncharacterized NAD-dependent epimerase/dehydratase family protein